MTQETDARETAEVLRRLGGNVIIPKHLNVVLGMNVDCDVTQGAGAAWDIFH